MSNLPKIGLLGLSLKLYDESAPHLKPGREIFIRKIKDSFSKELELIFTGACSTREEVDRSVEYMKSQDVSAILLIFLTYAPSLIALPALKRAGIPIIVWNTQEAFTIPDNPMPIFFQENHGVHGVQEMCNVLKRSSIKFTVISGHWLDKSIKTELLKMFTAAKCVSYLHKARIGFLGYTMQDMGDFNVDETALLSQAGASVIHIPIDEFGDFIDTAPEQAVNAIISQDVSSYEMDESILPEEHYNAAKVEWALRELIGKYKLQGWCQHFVVLGSSPRIPLLPFLAASKLMSEGITYSAEGDVCGAVGGYIMNIVSGNSTLSEVFTVDYEKKSVLMKHMGEMNISMAKKDRPVKVIRKNFALTKGKMFPPTPVFSLEPGYSTLLSISSSASGKLQFVVAEGEVFETEIMEESNTPYFRWKPSLDLEAFLDGYAYAGGTHHQAMGYGRNADTLKYLAKYLNIDIVNIS